MKTPRRIFPSHSPDFCVESLVRSLARARERSILLRRGSLVALASPPHLATPNVHANGVVSTEHPISPAAAPYVIGTSCRRGSFARIQFTGEPINYWHTYTRRIPTPATVFSLIESFVNLSSLVVTATMWVSLYVT